ncbi:MAG: permease [Limnochordia bacterium]|jgi:uncharacterized membrane protein YraQ (UPF0718 family)
MKKRLRPLLLLAVAYGILAITMPVEGLRALGTVGRYFKEVAFILPPVFVLMGLLDAWVPKETVELHLGHTSGLRGILLSIVLGSAAAGPIYVAFPVAVTLVRKGTRVLNIVVFLTAWAAAHLPMIIVEMRFLGLTFALIRTGLTLIMGVTIGIIMERMAVPIEVADEPAQVN